MKEFVKNIKFVWVYAKKQKKQLVKYILCNIIATIISIVVPIISAKIIVSLTSSLFQQLLFLAVILCLIECCRNVVQLLAQYYSQIIYRETFIELQTALGTEIMKLENRVIDKNNSGVFIQRLTNDTSRLSNVFNHLSQYLFHILTSIGILIAILIINFWAFLYLIVVLVILFFFEKRRTRMYHEYDKKFRKKNEKVSGFVGEIVRGIRDIKLLHAEENFTKELHDQVEKVNFDRYEMNATNRKYNFFEGSLRDIFDLLFIFLLVYLITQDHLLVVNALVLHNYSGKVPSIVFSIGVLFDSIKDFNLSACRVFDIMYGDEFSKEKFGSKHLDHVHGDFEFLDVSFHYDEGSKLVLKNLSFKVNANETVAFVGRSGAGKTTIFSLLCKMYDITQGKITIDGVDIRQLDRESIRKNITVISQNPYIFHLSIRDNLRLVCPSMTEGEMIEACKLACIHDFIVSLPDGYDTIVGEGGVNLSGGQKQRLAIARAFLQKTEIILFDEATSNLDNETQAKIQQAIDNLQKEYTILIIAHRLSTIKNANRILVLDDGQIVAEGSHHKLLNSCKLYKELYETEITRMDQE